jgi:hypothetical protein
MDFPDYAMWRRALAEFALLSAMVETETGLTDAEAATEALRRLEPRFAPYRAIPSIVQGFDRLTKSMGQPVATAWANLKQ